MSLPDISNTIYGFFFVATAVIFGAWRLFQYGTHKSVETHLEQQRQEFMEELKKLTDLILVIDKRTTRVEYALYNDGKTGLVQRQEEHGKKLDCLVENQAVIRTDVEVLKSQSAK